MLRPTPGLGQYRILPIVSRALRRRCTTSGSCIEVIVMSVYARLRVRASRGLTWFVFVGSALGVQLQPIAESTSPPAKPRTEHTHSGRLCRGHAHALSRVPTDARWIQGTGEDGHQDRRRRPRNQARRLGERSRQTRNAVRFHSMALSVSKFNWEWQRSEKELRRAIELNQNLAQAHIYYGQYLSA